MYMEEKENLQKAEEKRKRTRTGHGFWPHEVLRDSIIFASMLSILLFYAWLIPPPLHGAADPYAQAGFVFPDWYVLFSYGYLRWGEYLHSSWCPPVSSATSSANPCSPGTPHGGAPLSPVFPLVFSLCLPSSVAVKSVLWKTRGLPQPVPCIWRTSGSSRSFPSTSSWNCTGKTGPISVNWTRTAICCAGRENRG